MWLCSAQLVLLLSFILLSPAVTFLPEWVAIGFQNFAWAPSHKNRRILSFFVEIVEGV